MGMNGNRKPLILKGRNGGRAGTRTPDLLRVKKPGVLQRLHAFLVFAWPYTNSAHLLVANSKVTLNATAGLLEHFWTARYRSDTRVGPAETRTG